jgi:hypothetical protein
MKLLPKLLILAAFTLLGGCVVAPVGPPVGYYGARVVAPVPYVAVSPFYYGYGARFYYGRRW